MSDEPLMTREEVAAHLSIEPESVRSTLRRYGITEQRGYSRADVLAIERRGQGSRTDLARRRPDSSTDTEDLDGHRSTDQ